MRKGRTLWGAGRMFVETQWHEWPDPGESRGNQTPDPRLGIWGDHSKHLREQLGQKWGSDNSPKPAF